MTDGTDCTVCRDALLRADPSELERSLGENGSMGTSETALGRHIAECSRCHEAARRILTSNRVLREALGHPPRVDAEALVARAAFRPVDGAGGAKRPWRRWAALAAAASLAGVLVVREMDRPLQEMAIRTVIEPHAAFEVPANQNLAVLQTDNPDITVLWFF